MARLQHILFPYDFSTQGQHTVPFVRALASRLGARVTLLSVVPPWFEHMAPSMVPELPANQDLDALRRALQARTEQAFRDELSGLSVFRIAEAGDPAIRIADYAEDHDVDLIMMPTHGLGTFRSLLVGSVTSKVLHDSRRAVWTAAHAETQTAQHLPRTIMCAAGGGEGTGALLQFAADLSTRVGASLKVLQVVGPVSDWPGLESERRLQEQVREEASTAMAAAMAAAGVVAPCRTVVGKIADVTAEQARQDQADLVVIGRGAVAEPFGRLRSHALGIIQRAPCPVLSV